MDEKSESQRNTDIQHQCDDPVVLLLPPHQRVCLEVRDITEIIHEIVVMKDPAHMSPPESARGIVGISLVIGVLVMATVRSSPDNRRVLQRNATRDERQEAPHLRSLVGTVCEEAVVTDGDPESGDPPQHHC